MTAHYIPAQIEAVVPRGVSSSNIPDLSRFIIVIARSKVIKIKALDNLYSTLDRNSRIGCAA
jgi:hypothetical protein